MKLTTSWDLSPLGNGVTDPSFLKERTEIERRYKAFAKKWKGTSEYLENPKVLRDALNQLEQLGRKEGREDRYLFFRSCQNTQDAEVQAAIVRYRDFANKMSDHLRFFELSLATIPKEKQLIFLSSSELSPFKNYLQEIFESARYFLSEKEERILSMKSSVSGGNWVEMLDEFLSGETREALVKNAKGKKEKKTLSLSELSSLTKSNDKEILASAVEGITSILTQHEKVAEKEMNSFLENKKINDELRGFERPDSSRHNAEGISTKVVDTLVETVSDNFSISREYYSFKAKLLGRKSFHYMERGVEFGSIDTTYPYKEGVTIVEKSLRRISDEFADLFVGFAQNGQIDVFPKKGKTGGAFCLGSYNLPVNLMLNYTDSFRDITTLAHEMGHGIHAVKARKENTLNYDHPMCTAEVASTFCEDFVIDELKQTMNEEETLTLMVAQLEDKVSTIFRQIAAYKFEQELHNTFRTKGYLTRKEIGILFNKHMKAYMGSSVTFDEDSGRGWIYWSHFRNPFYVYAYSMALLVAQFARRKFLEDKNYIEKINQFYSTGSSLPPAEIFKNLGLDVHEKQSWQEGINEVKDLLKEAKKLAKKLGKV